MTREEKITLLNDLLEIEEKNDIGNLTRSDRAEFQMWVKEALEQEPKPKWIPATTPPKENGRYLVTRKCFTTFIDIVSYSTNLYKVNKYEFYDKKNKAGWWTSDSEYGSFEVDNVIGWQELPEKMESEVEE